MEVHFGENKLYFEYRAEIEEHICIIFLELSLFHEGGY